MSPPESVTSEFKTNVYLFGSLILILFSSGVDFVQGLGTNLAETVTIQLGSSAVPNIERFNVD